MYVQKDQTPLYLDHNPENPKNYCSQMLDGWVCTRAKHDSGSHEAVGTEGISFATWGLDESDDAW
jgi:hypothetical protein